MQLFYGHTTDNSSIELDEDESRHLKVLRKNEGETILVINGEGILYNCRIDKLGKRASLSILNSEQKTGFDSQIHLFVSPTKNMDRMEWMVEKCCEIGITSIQFIKCRYSERKNLKTDRLKRKALSAMKQSKQYYLSEIHELVPFSEALDRAKQCDQIFVAHCENEGEKVSPSTSISGHSTAIFIGPEGDFSSQEIELARKAGATELDLGQSILRTETAAMVATALFRNR